MNKKGQSILEYVIVLTAIVAAIVLLVAPWKDSPSDKPLATVINNAATRMDSATNRIGSDLFN